MMVDVGLDIPELVPALRSTYDHRVPKLYKVTVCFKHAGFASGEEQDTRLCIGAEGGALSVTRTL